jgi:type VI secretion system protein ImpE
VWLPAHVTWVNGGEAVLLVPSRYPGSARSTDDRIRLGRLTEWEDRGAELFTGLGQRLLTTDNGDRPLLEIRVIELDAADDEPQPDSATSGT